jgi:hypothetical protein
MLQSRITCVVGDVNQLLRVLLTTEREEISKRDTEEAGEIGGGSNVGTRISRHYS